MKLLIAIPALNEEQSIHSTIQRCLDARQSILENSPVTDVDITVVSDGSTDHTVDRAREFGSRINLIEFNPFPGVAYGKPPVRRMVEFRSWIQEGFRGTVTIRRSRGEDIHGACGQLTLAAGRAPAGASSDPGGDRRP